MMREMNLRLRLVVVALATMAATLGLAACGGSDEPIGAGNTDEEVQTAKAGKPTGELTVSNWPGYIDPGAKGTLAEFESETGVKVDYIEDVNDNAEFFGKLQPQLEQGESGGRSIFVVTDWMAKQMKDLGYLQNIDYADVPNVEANLRQDLRSPAIDPDRSYTIPWQTGLTGIWVNKKLAPDVTSINDLFDPKYKGKVTFLTEMRDSVALVLKADGIDPAEATKQEWLDAVEKINQAADSGQIRRFTGNDYTEDITSGNVVAAVGWSGDASLIGTPDAEWRMPDEGCMIWSDNAVIPVGAPNTAAALAFLDYAYDPKNAADIAEYVTYVTPVDNVQPILQKRDPALGSNELIFPGDDFTSECSTQVDPPGGPEGIQEVTEAYQDVITG